MKAMAKAWVEKAEADYGTAQREQKNKKDANYDAVCLHAELCAERYLKARLAEDDIPFPSTRHIVVLLMLAVDLEPKWEAFREQIRTLSSSAHLLLRLSAHLQPKAHERPHGVHLL